MKQFKGSKAFITIERELLARGFSPNYTDYNKGGDWRYFHNGTIAGQKIHKIGIGFAGHFFAVPINPITDKIEKAATHLSADMEGTPWYDALLNILYSPVDDTIPIDLNEPGTLVYNSKWKNSLFNSFNGRE